MNKHESWRCYFFLNEIKAIEMFISGTKAVAEFFVLFLVLQHFSFLLVSVGVCVDLGHR